MNSRELTDNDIYTLQCAVENMRAVTDPDDEAGKARLIDARWRLASKLEEIAKRASKAP